MMNGRVAVFLCRLLAICGLICATACERLGNLTSTSDNDATVADLKRRIEANDATVADLRGKIEGLRQTIAAQGARLSNEGSRIGWVELQLEWLQNKAVPIDPVTPGYQCIDTNTGRFLISCDDVKPYLDGQKVRLRIGNPSLVTYSGFRLKAQWGRKAPTYPTDGQQNPDSARQWSVAYDEWKQSLHEKEIASTAQLKPGVWNTVDIILAPAKANELGYLQVSMTTDKVLMYEDRER